MDEAAVVSAVSQRLSRGQDGAALREELIGAIARQLPGAVSPLRAYLRMMLRRQIDDSPLARQEYYTIMSSQADVVARLAEDLVEVIEAPPDASLLRTRPVEMNSALREQLRRFSAYHPGREIEFRPAGAPVHALADPSRLGLVVSSLLSNAVEHSPSHAVVELGLSMQDGEAVVSVRDEGEGISIAGQERALGNGSRPAKDSRRLSGPGLDVVRRLLEAMSGRLWVESTPGFGSTFSFSLPRA